MEKDKEEEKKKSMSKYKKANQLQVMRVSNTINVYEYQIITVCMNAWFPTSLNEIYYSSDSSRAFISSFLFGTRREKRRSQWLKSC